jgi:hypothetical protein
MDHGMSGHAEATPQRAPRVRNDFILSGWLCTSCFGLAVAEDGAGSVAQCEHTPYIYPHKCCTRSLSLARIYLELNLLQLPEPYFKPIRCLLSKLTSKSRTSGKSLNHLVRLFLCYALLRGSQVPHAFSEASR